MKRFTWNPLEAAAVVSSLLYTILYTYENIWCWLFAALSAAFFLILCFQRKIYAEWALQVFYLISAAYGYLNWGSEVVIPESMVFQVHLLIIGGGILLMLLSASLLKNYTEAALPLLDSFTTIFSIIATIFMVNFYPENWAYWIVIDAASIFLYFRRGLKISALLFVIYTLLSINGYLVWNGWL